MQLMYENLAREHSIARDLQALGLMVHRRAIAARRAQRIRRLLSPVAKPRDVGWGRSPARPESA